MKFITFVLFATIAIAVVSAQWDGQSGNNQEDSLNGSERSNSRNSGTSRDNRRGNGHGNGQGNGQGGSSDEDNSFNSGSNTPRRRSRQNDNSWDNTSGQSNTFNGQGIPNLISGVSDHIRKRLDQIREAIRDGLENTQGLFNPGNSNNRFGRSESNNGGGFNSGSRNN